MLISIGNNNCSDISGNIKKPHTLICMSFVFNVNCIREGIKLYAICGIYSETRVSEGQLHSDFLLYANGPIFTMVTQSQFYW